MPGFVIGLPFSSAHLFSDQRHAENFTKYLFSESKGHPRNDRTHLNMITETDPETREISSRYMNDTAEACGTFIADRLPKRGAEDLLADDGAYILCLIEAPSGRVISNFLRTNGPEIEVIGDAEIINIGLRAISEEVLIAHVAAFGSEVINLDDATAEEHAFVEAEVHDYLMRTWPGRTLMLASHHDQRIVPDNWHPNPFYHVHRLRIREPEDG